jgi:hypothetical protein
MLFCRSTNVTRAPALSSKAQGGIAALHRIKAERLVRRLNILPPRPGNHKAPLASAGPPRHTRGMSQEHDDYADRDVPPVRIPPAVVRLLVACAIMLMLFGSCLLIGTLIDVD